jgi:hypothetical protein
MCGVELNPDHRFCWSCGAPRWTPEAEAGSGTGAGPAEQRPPPVPGTPALTPTLPPRAQRSASLGPLPWFFAAGSIFFLVWSTEALAYFLSPTGRGQALDELAKQGYSGSTKIWGLALQAFFALGLGLMAAALHAAAFYGLRRLRRWGWLAAVVVAGFWSLLLVGIPVLRRLLSPPVRHAYGVD